MATPNTTRIKWVCDTCGSDIDPHATGVVGIPFRELSADLPTLRWRVQHAYCIDADQDVYGFDLNRLDDPADVVRITTHLMSKRWFPQSTWRGILLHLIDDRWAA